MINIIVAISENNAIGKDGKLLFRLKRDLSHFKEVTDGHVVVMGRKTYEDIGKPLTGRVNIVLTRQEGWEAQGTTTCKCLEGALGLAAREYPCKEVFIIGGGQVYKEALDKGLVDRLHVTKVKRTVESADTFFPKLAYGKEWAIRDVDRHFEDGTEFFIYKADKIRK